MAERNVAARSVAERKVAERSAVERAPRKQDRQRARGAFAHGWSTRLRERERKGVPRIFPDARTPSVMARLAPHVHPAFAAASIRSPTTFEDRLPCVQSIQAVASVNRSDRNRDPCCFRHPHSLITEANSFRAPSTPRIVRDIEGVLARRFLDRRPCRTNVIGLERS